MKYDQAKQSLVGAKTRKFVNNSDQFSSYFSMFKNLVLIRRDKKAASATGNDILGIYFVLAL